MVQTILPIFPEGCTPINAHLAFENREGTIYYFNGSFPVFSHEEKDIASFRMFTSQLYVNGNCKQADIIRAFGVTKNSVIRSVKKYEEEGPAGFFVKKKRNSQPRVLTKVVMEEAQRQLNEGAKPKDVAQSLEIKPDTLKKAISSGRLISLHGSKKKKI